MCAVPLAPPPPNTLPFGLPIRHTTCFAVVDHVIVVSPTGLPSSVMIGSGFALIVVPDFTIGGGAGIIGSGAGFAQAQQTIMKAIAATAVVKLPRTLNSNDYILRHLLKS